MKLLTLDKNCATRLNNRLADEYKACYFYRSAANYCKSVGYDGGYSYFTKEAESELQHAKCIEDYLCDWNVLPELRPIETPQSFDGLVDIIESAYQLELDLHEAYKEDSQNILDDNTATFTFLQQFLKIQSDSVSEYATLTNKLELIGDDKLALFYFDKEVLGE